MSAPAFTALTWAGSYRRTRSLSAVDRLPAPDTLLVTGAAGWFGRALLDRLGHDAAPPHVVAVVRDPAEAGAVRALAPRARIVQADVTDPSAWDGVVPADAGTIDVIHAAGVIHPPRVADFDAVNHRGTAVVVSAARRAGVRRFVHVSSNSPFGVNPTPRDTFGEHEPYHPYLGYGRSKMNAELHVLAAVDDGLDAVIVRPPWFYGPWQPARQTTFFSMVRAGRFPVVGDGSQRRSMVYVGNLADGVLRAASAVGVTGRAYWIADATPYRITDIVEAVRTALEEHDLPCRHGVLGLPAVVGAVAERADRAIQRFGRYQQQLHVLGELRHTIAVDIGAARRDLGYEPGIALLDGMRRSVRWCLDQGYAL